MHNRTRVPDGAVGPIAPASTRILIDDKPDFRSSWAPHGVLGYYLGPALQHYRSYRVKSSATKATRISDTLAWFPQGITIPGPSPRDTLHAAVIMLHSALTEFTQLPSDLRVAAQPGASTVTSFINDLAGILGIPSPPSL